ncbi:MAG: C40 family peptidase [Verrucomicrobiae bacterium]|nr:C40 family peptidase [Verrucomicrobiae bacterium]NNJ41760.1 hypothetical protein [Akkermansiaceae bacterium]
MKKITLVSCVLLWAHAGTLPVMAAKTSYTSNGVTYHRPATLAAKDITGFRKLSKVRQEVIAAALTTARKHRWLKYRFGAANPSAGGFDCSGAMYYVLRNSGYRPPRTSAQQYIWVRDSRQITHVAGRPQSLDDKAFNKLTSGDLIFWSGTYAPTDGRMVKITHVSLYLGQEKDGRHVMIGASKGRSYRGKKGDGYGVYDFNLPRKGSKSRLVGYGPPPRL